MSPSPQLSPGSLLCFCSLSRPALLAQSLLGRGLCGFSLAPQLCPLCHGDFCGLPSAPRNSPPVLGSWRLSQLHSPSLCITGLVWLVSAPQVRPLVAGLVCACLGSPGHPLHPAGLVCACLGSLCPASASWGLCVLVWAPRPHSQHRRTCVCLSGLPASLSASAGLVCACLSSLGPPCISQGSIFINSNCCCC